MFYTKEKTSFKIYPKLKLNSNTIEVYCEVIVLYIDWNITCRYKLFMRFIEELRDRVGYIT